MRPAIAFRQSTTLQTDDALECAHAVYSAADTANDPTLEWLESLASSGRQLYLTHAMGRLKAWNNTARKSLGLAQEAAILDRLAGAAGPCSALLGKPDVAPLEQAFVRQVVRLKAFRVRSLQDGLTQALALLQASRALTQPGTLEQDAGQLLAAICPVLVAADGSPQGLDLPDYAAALGQLYESGTLFSQSPVQEALDHARPFLAMCLDATGHYVFDTHQPVPEAVRRTAPLSCAPLFGSARLAAEKTLVLAGFGGPHQPVALNLSASGQRLLHLDTPGVVPGGAFTITSQSTALGHGLEHATPAARCTAFLNAEGNDLRVEHVFEAPSQPDVLHFSFAPEAKLSLARSGEQATLSLSARQTWQLTLRGGRLHPSASPHGLAVRCTTTGQATRINWALKRLSRPATRSGADNTAELPF